MNESILMGLFNATEVFDIADKVVLINISDLALGIRTTDILVLVQTIIMEFWYAYVVAIR